MNPFGDIDEDLRRAMQWCEPDGCPSGICGGPHYEVETDFGTEVVPVGQEPIGRPVIGSPGLNCQSCGMLPDQQHDEGCPEGDTGGPVWPG